MMLLATTLTKMNEVLGSKMLEIHPFFLKKSLQYGVQTLGSFSTTRLYNITAQSKLHSRQMLTWSTTPVCF